MATLRSTGAFEAHLSIKNKGAYNAMLNVHTAKQIGKIKVFCIAFDAAREFTATDCHTNLLLSDFFWAKKSITMLNIIKTKK